MKRTISLILTISMLLLFVSCGVKPEESPNGDSGSEVSSGKETNLMENISARNVELQPDKEAGNTAATEFGVKLIKNSMESGENVLISPLSVLCALAMTANGAKEETLAQMEEAFGLSVDELNNFLCWYLASLPRQESCSLRVANSIWVNDHIRFTPEQSFLQLNADYYGADIYTTPFDAATLDAINDWVEDKTEGMIPKILDQIPQEALMYLVNALAFEARWASVYEKYQVREGVFTKEDGTEQTVELMYSQESRYLENEQATGFIKYYEGRSYAFVGLLPKEGVTMEEYLASLTGEQLRALLDGAQGAMVETAIPKFETEYSTELSDVLASMGMTDAFDENAADFTGIGTSTEGNLFISRVLHKTFISVGEQGTKAGAATVVEIADATSMPLDDVKKVYLDRPFIYLLIDCENGMPFFIGVMMDVNA